MIGCKLIRILRGFSQFELSIQTGIPNYRISKLETGRVEPTDAELQALAQALDTAPEQLSRRVDPERLLARA